MITIIKRELLDNLKNTHFLVLLVSGIAFFLMNGLIFISRYKEDIAVYHERISQINSIRSTCGTAFYKHPSPLMFIAEGGEKFKTKEYWLSPKGEPYPSPYTSLPRNFTLPDLPELDWAFIIKVMFSLYVILLGYNSISGEREDGTLSLIMSNSLSRIKVLVAKYCAILLTVTIPLLLGILSSLIVFGMFTPEIFTLDYLLKLLIILVLVLIFLSIFIFFCLFLSSIIYQSSLVLLVLLMSWIIFIIIPDISGIIANKYFLHRRLFTMTRIINNMESFETNNTVVNQIQKTIKRLIESGDLTTEEDIKEKVWQMIEQKNNDMFLTKKDYELLLRNRERIADNLSRISPFALFQYALETIAGTGRKRHDRFLSEMNAFSLVYDQYIVKKLGKLIGESYYVGRWVFNVEGREIKISTPEPEEYSGDKADFPLFSDNSLSNVYVLHDMVIDFIGLLLWNIVLAIGALTAFNRADVRQ